MAERSLEANTDALSQLVGTAYDDIQGDRFKGYVTDLSSYANGVVSQDASAKQAARADLMAYCDDYGAWLATASNGQVRAGDAVRTARTRVVGLIKQVDAYAADDYDQAYKIERQAYQSSFTAGATLAKASVTPKAAAALDAPPERLRSFAMLLGEHMELIIDAQRATFAGSSEFKAAAVQVNANSATLTQAMGAIVGPKKAAEFQTAWANHVEGLMAYSTAVAGNDEAAKTTATQNLDGFAARLALYFSDIVRNELPVEALTDVLSVHDTPDRAGQRLRRKRLRQGATDAAGGLPADAGRGQHPGRRDPKTVKPGLPVGGSKTGGGRTAQPPR